MPLSLTTRSSDARQAFCGVHVTKLAYARGKGGSQRLVDVKHAFCDDLAVGRREDELVKALRALDVVEQPTLALVGVVYDQLAEAVLVLEALDGGEQRLLAHEIRKPPAHIANDRELVLAADDPLTDLMQVERGALAVGIVAQLLRGRQHERLVECRLDQGAVVTVDGTLAHLVEACALQKEATKRL